MIPRTLSRVSEVCAIEPSRERRGQRNLEAVHSEVTHRGGADAEAGSAGSNAGGTGGDHGPGRGAQLHTSLSATGGASQRTNTAGTITSGRTLRATRVWEAETENMVIGGFGVKDGEKFCSALLAGDGLPLDVTRMWLPHQLQATSRRGALRFQTSERCCADK